MHLKPGVILPPFCAAVNKYASCHVTGAVKAQREKPVCWGAIHADAASRVQVRLKCHATQGTGSLYVGLDTRQQAVVLLTEVFCSRATGNVALHLQRDQPRQLGRHRRRQVEAAYIRIEPRRVVDVHPAP